MVRKVHMNRRYTIGDSVESVERAVYHRNNRRPSNRPPVTNGAVNKSKRSDGRSDSLSSNSDFAAVTINFNNTSKETLTAESSPMPTLNNEILPMLGEITVTSNDLVRTSSLPWQDNLDPSPTHLADSIPNNEPVIAHVPSWVNNLSYSHITETGSPYVSPQTTVIAPKSDYHKTVFSLFDEIVEKTADIAADSSAVQQSVTSSDYFPTPWGQSVEEDCPQLSPMVMESIVRSDDFLHSTHCEQAPDHHHVIIPTPYHIDSSNSSVGKPHTHLTEVASAPDFQHWKPIAKAHFYDDNALLQSDPVLTEMAFQEGVKSRVAQWLKQADDDEENDADEENDDDDDDDDGGDDDDGLGNAIDLEKEFDIAMSLDKKQL